MKGNVRELSKIYRYTTTEQTYDTSERSSDAGSASGFKRPATGGCDLVVALDRFV